MQITVRRRAHFVAKVAAPFVLVKLHFGNTENTAIVADLLISNFILFDKTV